jgi:hypothetical protein
MNARICHPDMAGLNLATTGKLTFSRLTSI